MDNDTLFCVKCGQPILKTSNFCPNCGAPVARISDEADGAPNTGPVADRQTDTGYTSPGLWEAMKKSKINALLLIAFVAAVLFTVMSTISDKQNAAVHKAPPSPPLPKPTEIKKIPCPAVLSDARANIDVIGQPVIFVNLSNNTDKTIDGFKVRVTATNNFGEVIRGFGYGDDGMTLVGQMQIGPGASSGFGRYWTMHGFESGTKFHIVLTDIHFTDGTSWGSAQSEPETIDVTRTDDVIG